MKKMKHLLLAALTLCVCAACNSELGPEYSTAPQLGEVNYSPRYVTADDAVEVTVSITSEYGLHSAWVVYCLNDDMTTSKSVCPVYYKGETDKAVIYRAENAIPKQPAGTKVVFQVQTVTPYGVYGVSAAQTYTVAEGAEETPEVPEIDEN